MNTKNKKKFDFIIYSVALCLSLLLSCQNPDPGANLKIVNHFFIDGYAARNFDVINATIAEDYVGYSNGQKNKLIGPEAQIKGIENELRVHPDFRIKIDDIFASTKGKVTVRWTANWTDQKSGRNAILYGTWIAEVKNSKIIKSWNVYDLLGTSNRLKK